MFKGKPGDLIEINYWPYHHWAVYIGENEVIHFGGNSSDSSANQSSSNGKVKREKLRDVVGNHRYQVNNLLDKKWNPRDPSVIVNEARAMVGERSYNVVTYNCEHFATEMRYGEAESQQVKAALEVFARDAGPTFYCVIEGLTVLTGLASLTGIIGPTASSLIVIVGGLFAFYRSFQQLRGRGRQQEENKKKS